MGNKKYRISGELFAEMVMSGAVNLRNNAQTVNELNVFPIPDGDTGENMARTVEGGVSALTANCGELSAVARDLARGMLLSARGNSGVILSQFFEGMRRGFDGCAEAGVAELKRGFSAGVAQAYSAVVKPTEGTILTVMREASAAAERIDDGESVEEYFSVFIDEMYASLDRTPDLLPVLKESGVIDSGGAGFVYIVEGMNSALRGAAYKPASAVSAETAAADIGADAFDADSEMKFGYCTELIVQLSNRKTDAQAYDIQSLIEYLESIGGESVVAFKTGTRVKLHVHTFEPDKVIAYCLSVGELIAVKVENMSVQHTEAVVRNRFERQTAKHDRKKFACVAVADGDGLIEQFKSLGADCVVDGKQTMNPSTGDFLAAFDKADAQTIFVLPNNANVIMAAKQAAEMYAKSKVIVIPSETLAEGYSAMSMHDYSSEDEEQITEAFMSAIGCVTTGSITYSVRDCELNGKHIDKGDFMGLEGKKLVSCEKDLLSAAYGLLDGIDKTDKSVIIAIRGKDCADDVITENIARYVKENFADLEFYSFDGGQDVYSFIFVVE